MTATNFLWWLQTALTLTISQAEPTALILNPVHKDPRTRAPSPFSQTLLGANHSEGECHSLTSDYLRGCHVDELTNRLTSSCKLNYLRPNEPTLVRAPRSTIEKLNKNNDKNLNPEHDCLRADLLDVPRLNPDWTRRWRKFERHKLMRRVNIKTACTTHKTNQ